MKQIALKTGITKTLTVNGKVIPVHEEDAIPLFEEHTGLTLNQFRKAYERIHNPRHCPHCGSTKREYYSGYPGEEFNCCGECGKILNTIFNMGAVI